MNTIILTLALLASAPALACFSPDDVPATTPTRYIPDVELTGDLEALATRAGLNMAELDLLSRSPELRRETIALLHALDFTLRHGEKLLHEIIVDFLFNSYIPDPEYLAETTNRLEDYKKSLGLEISIVDLQRREGALINILHNSKNAKSDDYKTVHGFWLTALGKLPPIKTLHIISQPEHVFPSAAKWLVTQSTEVKRRVLYAHTELHGHAQLLKELSRKNRTDALNRHLNDPKLLGLAAGDVIRTAVMVPFSNSYTDVTHENSIENFKHFLAEYLPERIEDRLQCEAIQQMAMHVIVDSYVEQFSAAEVQQEAIRLILTYLSAMVKEAKYSEESSNTTASSPEIPYPYVRSSLSVTPENPKVQRPNRGRTDNQEGTDPETEIEGKTNSLPPLPKYIEITDQQKIDLVLRFAINSARARELSSYLKNAGPRMQEFVYLRLAELQQLQDLGQTGEIMRRARYMIPTSAPEVFEMRPLFSKDRLFFGFEDGYKFLLVAEDVKSGVGRKQDVAIVNASGRLKEYRDKINKLKRSEP